MGQLNSSHAPISALTSMAPMKAMGAKAMTWGGIAEALSASTEMKKSMCGQILNSLAEIEKQEVKSTGVFTIPGVCKIKTRMKPARKVVKAFSSHTSWLPHTLFFKAETGKAFTTFLAGFAFTITTFPKTSLFPALVAGFMRVLILQTPGMVNIPVLFTSCVAISARLFRICPHTLFFVSVLVDRASAMPPFVIAFAFIAFIGAIAASVERNASEVLSCSH